MSSLKQRVPLILEPKELFINIEWLRDLQAVISDAAAAASSTSDLATLIAQVQALSITAATLTGALTDILTRIQKLEDGYQS